MKTKKIISLLLAVVMIAGVLPMSASAFSIDDAKAIIVDATENFVKAAKDAVKADLVRVAADQMNAKNVETVKELLDNGTDVFVEGSEIDATAVALGCKVSGFGPDDVLLGGYVTANGEDYELTIIGAVLTGNDIDPVERNRFSQIKAEDVLDYNDLVASFDISEDSDKAVDGDTASLQAAQTSSKGKTEKAAYRRYWFAKSESSTNYALSSSSPYCVLNSNGTYTYWVYEGYLEIAPTFYWMASTKNDPYKYVYVDCNVMVTPASGENANYVTGYTFSIETVNPGDKIITYKNVKPESATSTIKYEMATVSSSYEGFSTSVSYPVQVLEWETTEPEGLATVTEAPTDTCVSWKVTPVLKEKDKLMGQVFAIEPGALVCKNTQNRTNDFNIFLYFDVVQLNGGFRSYSLNDNTMAESLRGQKYTVSFSEFQ